MSEPPSDVEAAKENLRVIRQLMEKATVYRTISVPVAFAGGGLALLLAVVLRWKISSEPSFVTPAIYLGTWLGALVLMALFNTWLIHRDAAAGGEPLMSPRMRLALGAFAPAFFAGGVTGVAIAIFDHDLLMCTNLWLVFYGLALLATGNFSPSSIRRLGIGFLAFGLFAFLLTLIRRPSSINDANLLAATLMGAGFGMLHIAYGISVAFQSRRA